LHRGAGSRSCIPIKSGTYFWDKTAMQGFISLPRLRRKYVSVEHGRHHQETPSNIIATLFLVFLIFPCAIKAAEDTVQALVTGESGDLHGH